MYYPYSILPNVRTKALNVPAKHGMRARQACATLRRCFNRYMMLVRCLLNLIQLTCNHVNPIQVEHKAFLLSHVIGAWQ